MAVARSAPRHGKPFGGRNHLGADEIEIRRVVDIASIDDDLIETQRR